MDNIRSISRIEPGQLALMMGAGYAILGVIFGLLFFGVASFLPAASPFGGMGPAMMIVAFPIMYGIMGYILGLISAVIYNILAGTVGGIKVTVSD
jgi:hypothetical protein